MFEKLREVYRSVKSAARKAGRNTANTGRKIPSFCLMRRISFNRLLPSLSLEF
ncbi:MAG: hypothetical protein ACLFM9_02495 [Candidatus Aenigmatarchaeota archaeon]